MQKPVFTLELVESKMVTPKVKHFTFKIVDNPEFKFVPGQFISLHFNNNDGMPIKRSYSIATIEGNKDELELAATFVEGGPGTEFLYQLKPGEEVMASGPYGKLVIKEELPKRHIFIGTGTGIAPYRSMLTRINSILDQDQSKQAVIILGVQKAEEALYKDDFLSLNHKDNYSFRAYYSREKENLDNSFEFNGYVQHSFDDISPDPEKDIVYLCGNPYMIEDCVNLLMNLGFTSKQIIREKYYSKSSGE